MSILHARSRQISSLLIFFFCCCKWGGFCAIEATLKLINLYIKGCHKFRFNVLSYSIFTVAWHTAGRILISFLPARIQNNSSGFDVSTWQREYDSAVCSFIYQLSPINCWSCAPKILLNLESSRAVLLSPMSLGPRFAHVRCSVRAAVPLTGPLCLRRATLRASQQELVLGSASGWAALPTPGSLTLPAVGDATIIRAKARCLR